MIEWASVAGMVGGAVAVLKLLADGYKRRGLNEAQRIELEAKHSQAVLDRLQRLEFAEAAADAKIEELNKRATAAELRAAGLEWELARARQETEAERSRGVLLARELSDLKRQRAGLSAAPDERIDTPLRPPRGGK